MTVSVAADWRTSSTGSLPSCVSSYATALSWISSAPRVGDAESSAPRRCGAGRGAWPQLDGLRSDVDGARRVARERPVVYEELHFIDVRSSEASTVTSNGWPIATSRTVFSAKRTAGARPDRSSQARRASHRAAPAARGRVGRTGGSSARQDRGAHRRSISRGALRWRSSRSSPEGYHEPLLADGTRPCFGPHVDRAGLRRSASSSNTGMKVARSRPSHGSAQSRRLPYGASARP